jgi:phospholipid/cholesterol/gamma-HCH transport system permease protein
VALVELAKSFIFGAGYTLVLLFETILQFRAIFFKRNEIVQQMFTAGISSFFVVSIVAVFTGMIMGLNAGLGLKDFGAEGQIGLLLTITLTREMSPFMTALILSASVGSAIAAEIGTMKVSEEIDALEVMSISPVRYLVMPRVIGFSLMVPVLCIYSSILGVFGGAVVGHFQLGVEYQVYFNDVLNRVGSVPGLKDLYVAKVISQEEELIAMSKKGQVIRTQLSSVPSLGRQTQGVSIMKMRAGDGIASLTCL